jgi:hypothetical protein
MRFTRNTALVGVIVAAAVAFLSAPIPANAQSVAMKVSIPFEFRVANLTLPAGTYIVQRMGDALRIADRNGHTATVISTSVTSRSVGSKNEIVFNQYGDLYFLTEARWQGYNSARGLMKSKAEIELAKAVSSQRLDLAGVVR